MVGMTGLNLHWAVMSVLLAIAAAFFAVLYILDRLQTWKRRSRRREVYR
jgi:hypothetical protein